VMIPIMVGMIIFSKPIVQLLFEGGSFTSRDTQLTSTALLCYSLGMVSFGIRDIVSRGFYSLQDTKTPVKNAMVAVVIDIVFSILLVRVMGIGGLALSTSIATTVGALLLIISLRRKVGKLGIKSSLITGLKSIVASIIMGIICKELYTLIMFLGGNYTHETKKLVLVALIITSSVGAIVYLILSLLFNIKEVRDIVSQVKMKYIQILKK
ncbi:MAG: murein biosynthesis integral membrane protein MurJ, partial [Paraclostridium bifermentans]